MHPKEGKMTFTLHNKRDQPIDILDGFDIGAVVTAAAMNEAIDLSIMRGYISTVEMSETRLVNCLCPETVGTNVGIIMALDDDDYSCLGANMGLSGAAWRLSGATWGCQALSYVLMRKNMTMFNRKNCENCEKMR